ncbi:MAG: AAA-like domain-containing protein [Chloroflexota bacterium]
MTRFTSYGPVDEKRHYHVPRTELINQAFNEVMGEEPAQGGHYITVWAPRQAGKTWVLQNVLWRIRENAEYDWIDAVKVNLQDLKLFSDANEVASIITSRILRELGIDPKQFPLPKNLYEFSEIFTHAVLKRPLILIMDEFDALQPHIITAIAGVFRNIYIHRSEQRDKTTAEKYYLLHGVALIGVRSVLGIENKSGSPFNIQRSVKIPNLTYAEVKDLFHQYIEERGQIIEQDVIDRVYYEVRGQPGLTCWIGELMTEKEKFNPTPTQPIIMAQFEYTYSHASNTQPNANITNLIQKAREPKYKERVIELFQTIDKVDFSFDDEELNFLYMNGVIDYEEVDADQYAKFPNPFVQKRLFNAFAREMFRRLGQLHAPFIEMDNIINETSLNVPNILRLYEGYLQKNRQQVLKNAPLRADLHVHEATFHFHLYKYLSDFMKPKGGQVVPEFPTGNGQIDLLIHHAGEIYGLEVKSFSGQYEYKKALVQTAKYAKKMGWSVAWLVFFTEQIDDKNRAKYEVTYHDEERNVTIEIVFVQTGEALEKG